MGLRSAFNPLGTLPYTATGSYDIIWTVDNINMKNSSLVLPTGWLIGGVESVTSFISSTEDTVHPGCYVVTLGANSPAGASGSTVALNDSNFTANS